MSAKQVSSGYILWKTGPEPVRHSHSGERRLLTAAPHRNCQSTQVTSFIRPGIRLRRQYGGERTPSASVHSKEILRDSAIGGKLFQPAPAPKKRLENSAEKAGLFQLVSIQRKFLGIVWKRSGCPVGACYKGILRDSAVGGKLFQPVPAPKKRLENSSEKVGLFQLVSIQRKFPGIVWKRSGCSRLRLFRRNRRDRADRRH